MKDYRFSVSMCVYGRDNAQYFDEALNSVYSQTLVPDEVVLVVDGPVPEMIDQVIGKYEKKHNMKVFRLEKNMGHGIARREGFNQCQYDYIAIADADDINVADRFEKQIQLFKSDPSLGAVSSNCCHFSKSIDEIINVEELPSSDEDIKKYLRRRCPICQPSVMLSKKAVEEAGGYLDWYHAEDYYLWIRMYLNNCRFANIPETLLYLRTTEQQMNRRGGMKYFTSMAKLYIYMFNHKVIGPIDLLFNISSRFLMQVILPNRIRAYIRKKFL